MTREIHDDDRSAHGAYMMRMTDIAQKSRSNRLFNYESQYM